MTLPHDIARHAADADCSYLDAAVELFGADPNRWPSDVVDLFDHAGDLEWCDGCDRYLRVDGGCECAAAEPAAMPFGIRCDGGCCG